MQILSITKIDAEAAEAALMQDYTICCEQLPERTIKSAINHAFEIQTQLKAKERKAALQDAVAA